MDNICNFVRAENEDIESIALIEKEFFGDYSKAFDLDFFKKWYAYNPDMFYVVKNYKGEVTAFTIMTPVTEEVYGRLYSGEINDMYDFDFGDVLKEKKSTYYYVADICASKEKNPREYLVSVTHLISGIIDFLAENANYILTSPVTGDGNNMCRHMGFNKVSSSYFDGKEYPICELVVNDESKDRLTKLSRKLVKK